MIEFQVDDMTCGHCASAIAKAVQSLDRAAKVEIDLPARRVRVESTVGPYKLAAAIRSGIHADCRVVERAKADKRGDLAWNGYRKTGSGWH